MDGAASSSGWEAPGRPEMRVLLTGATGLLGRALLGRLLETGDEVTALALPTTVSELPVHPGLAIVPGRLEEPGRLALAARGCEVAIHAAAELPGASPADIERVNVVGTENLLLAAAEARARRFVLLSSTAVYANLPPGRWPIAEEGPLGPSRPGSIAYGRSKIAAEGLLTRFRRRHRMQSAILRAPTVYGRGAPMPERIVAELAARPLATLHSGLAGVPMQWVYAGDLAEAVLAAANAPLDWAVCNVAGGELFDLHTLARLVHGLPWSAGRAALGLPDLRALPLRYDLSRAAQILGWQPTTRLAEGLAEMLDGRARARWAPGARGLRGWP